MGKIYKNKEIYGSNQACDIEFKYKRMNSINVEDAIREAYDHVPLSTDIQYDNTFTQISKTNIQDAIDFAILMKNGGGSTGSASLNYTNLLESGVYIQTSSSIKYVSYNLTDKLSNYDLIKIVGSYYSSNGVEQFACNYWSPEDLLNYKSTISGDEYWAFNMNVGSTNRRIAYMFEEGENVDKFLLTRTESMALNSIWGIKFISNRYPIITKEEFDALTVKEINLMGIFGVRSDYNINYIDGAYYYKTYALIPVLTSNEGENGVASCPLSSPLYNGKNSSSVCYAWHAFDEDDSTYLEYYGENQSGAYCRYDFNEPVNLKYMEAKIGHYNTGNNFNYYLQYLKEGTEDEWITVGEGTHTGPASIVTHKLQEVVKTSSVRFYSTTKKTTGTNIFLYKLQAYGW